MKTLWYVYPNGFKRQKTLSHTTKLKIGEYRDLLSFSTDGKQTSSKLFKYEFVEILEDDNDTIVWLELVQHE